MSIQFRCRDTNHEQTGTSLAYFNIPVKVAIEGEKQSTFFDEINEIRTKEIDRTKLPYNLTIHHWGDLLDVLVAYDDVLYFEGKQNFPPCEERAFWFHSLKPQIISKELLEQLKQCICDDPLKCPEGNYRLEKPKKSGTNLYIFPH